MGWEGGRWERVKLNIELALTWYLVVMVFIVLVDPIFFDNSTELAAQLTCLK